MKKILIVGGGVNQMPLILAAKAEGYVVVVVDYAGKECPAYAVADRLYDVSTQDEDAIMEVARKEGIDGIISNSEPSMLIVNSIAERLQLVGNPTDGIEQLTSKGSFRRLQRRVGVFAPDCHEVATEEEAVRVAERMSYPIIVKPCESSGSRGCKRIERFEREIIAGTFLECSRYSRNGKVVIEEYVPMPSLRTIEGDIFVYGDTIIWEGLYHTTRAGWAPMVPMTYTAPMRKDERRMESLRSTILRVLQGAGIRFGQFNIEGYFTHTGEFFIIEINARQGGNFLPRFLRRFTGIDYNRLLVTTCVKEEGYINEVATSERPHRFAMMSSVYSQEAGVYQGLAFDPLIRDKIKDVRQLVSAGEAVEKCIDGTSIVASIDLEFDSMEELDAFTPLVVDGIRVRIV